MVKDIEVKDKLPTVLKDLIGNEEKVRQLETNIKKMGIIDATDRIVDEVLKLMKA